MSLKVVLRAAAQAEFDEAFDYYEGKRAGHGVKFADQVQKVLDRIGANPDLHPLVFADIRKAAVSRFPYCVYYRADIARVEVIAVFHTSRDPSVWKGRI
jgi:plasmid stabilization system protein ParE